MSALNAAASVVASYQLENNPSIAGHAVYFAMEVKMGSESGRLSLMIDPGDGVWRYSNSTRGVACSATLGLSCGGAVKGGFGMRSFQAALLWYKKPPNLITCETPSHFFFSINLAGTHARTPSMPINIIRVDLNTYMRFSRACDEAMAAPSSVPQALFDPFLRGVTFWAIEGMDEILANKANRQYHFQSSRCCMELLDTDSCHGTVL